MSDARRRPVLWASIVATLALLGAAVALGPGRLAAVARPEPEAVASESTVTVPVVADAYGREDMPSTNFGGSIRFSVQGDPGYRRTALLRFLPAVPPDRVVTSARLRLFGASSSVKTGGADLYLTTGAWTEDGLVWSNTPPAGVWLGKEPVTPHTWTEWDVTSVVAAGTSQVDFQLSTADSGWRGFASGESSGSHAPQLVLTTQQLDPVAAPTPTAAPSGSPTVAPSAPAVGAVRIAAVGDMNPKRNVSTTSPSGRNGASIAQGLADGSLDAFFGLGDFQYSTAFCADYVNYWKRLWGGTKSKLYWVSGPNHDWEPGRNEDLDDFMNGQCAGDTTKAAINAERGFIGNGEAYSRDFGSWHVAFLPSALWRYDPARAQQVTTWLDDDLAAARAAGKHLAVVYHDPYFTSDTSSHTRASNHKPWIDVMYKHRVRLTLSGSQHNYERSCPVDNADRCVADGMTAFQVSTGGVTLRPFASSPSYIAHRFSDTHGWLKLTLNLDGSFDWQYVPVVGTSTDTGTRPAP